MAFADLLYCSAAAGMIGRQLVGMDAGWVPVTAPAAEPPSVGSARPSSLSVTRRCARDALPRRSAT